MDISGNIRYARQRQTKQKESTPGVGHRYSQANTNIVRKTLVLLQTTGGKDEPNIVFMRKSYPDITTRNSERRDT